MSKGRADPVTTTDNPPLALNTGNIRSKPAPMAVRIAAGTSSAAISIHMTMIFSICPSKHAARLPASAVHPTFQATICPSQPVRLGQHRLRRVVHLRGLPMEIERGC